MVGELSSNTNTVGFRTFIRGCNSDAGNPACASTRNVAYAINAVPYNGANDFNNISFGSNHTNGANFLLGDGSTRFLSQSINLTVYLQYASRNGGEVATLD